MPTETNCLEPMLPDDIELTDEVLKERKKAALSHDTLPDYMVSRDGTAALMYITVKPALGGSPDYEGFLEGVTDKTGNIARVCGPRRRNDPGRPPIMITGGPAINHSFKEAAEADIQTIFPIVLG